MSTSSYRSRRRTPATASGCDVCGDKERLELARLPDGRFACVLCRYDLGRRQQAAARRRDEAPRVSPEAPLAEGEPEQLDLLEAAEEHGPKRRLVVTTLAPVLAEEEEEFPTNAHAKRREP